MRQTTRSVFHHQNTIRFLKTIQIYEICVRHDRCDHLLISSGNPGAEIVFLDVFLADSPTSGGGSTTRSSPTAQFFQYCFERGCGSMEGSSSSLDEEPTISGSRHLITAEHHHLNHTDIRHLLITVILVWLCCKGQEKKRKSQHIERTNEQTNLNIRQK